MSRPIVDVMRPPGVYTGFADSQVTGLTNADTRVAGFVGISQKGPLDEPRRIASWDEFVEVYGGSETYHLARSVEGFFLNGGEACYVVRIAHRPRGEKELTGPEHAFSAERVARDTWDKPSIRVRARSEGKWGNNIWVRFNHAIGAKALLTEDLQVGAGEARLNTTRGYERGMLVRIYNRENSDYVILTEVEDRLIRWSSATPVNRRYRAAGPTYLEVLELELHVTLRERREAFKNLQLSPLSRRYIGRVVNEDSRLVLVDDLKSATAAPHNLPKAEQAAKLTNGRDGLDDLTPDDFIGYNHGPGERAGLLALGGIDEVALLAVPDAMVLWQRKAGPQSEMAVQRIQDQMVMMCENLKDRFAILDGPLTRDIEVVKRWRRRIDSSFAAMYWPWVGIVQANGKVTMSPPSGHLAGVYARCDTQVGVHRAPANEVVRGVVDVSLVVSEDDQGALNSESINTFNITRGIRPWGARTLSSDPSWRYVNVRRLFIMLRRSLDEGTRWAVFEPNTNNTWQLLADSVRGFLVELYKKGMFAGGNPEDSFYVKCDAETNSPDVLEQGQLVCNIGVAPVVPAEFILISVVQKLHAEGE